MEWRKYVIEYILNFYFTHVYCIQHNMMSLYNLKDKTFVMKNNRGQIDS